MSLLLMGGSTSEEVNRSQYLACISILRISAETELGGFTYMVPLAWVFKAGGHLDL